MNFISKENPSQQEVMELRLNLRDYNNQFIKNYERISLMQLIRSEENDLLGGVYGSISWGWLYIDLLWVNEQFRGTGAGTKLLNRIEDQAKQKGVRRFRLDTTSFQALDFYKKMGYKVCGEIEDLPPGHTNYSLIKTEL